MSMAAPPVTLNPHLQALARSLGAEIRRQRKALKVSAVAAAEAAGISRVTWHRVEKGEVSVSFGAYLVAADVVGLRLSLFPAGGNEPNQRNESIPVRITLADYPQLKRIAWSVTGVDTLTPLEALNLYERNWRYVDEDGLEPAERELIGALRRALGQREDSGNRHV